MQWTMGTATTASASEWAQQSCAASPAQRARPAQPAPSWHPNGAAAAPPPRSLAPRRCSNDTFSIYDILKANFDEAYAGNRAPFPVGPSRCMVRQGTGWVGGRLP